MTGSGTNVITVVPPTPLEDYTEYYIQIDGGTFKNDADTSYTGLTNTDAWNFTTQDIDAIPPTIETLSPADESTGVNVDTNLIMTFSENVFVGTGDIVIRKLSDNSTVETIDVTSGQVT